MKKYSAEFNLKKREQRILENKQYSAKFVFVKSIAMKFWNIKKIIS